MTFEARLRKNLLRLWFLGVIINTTILFWIGAGKFTTVSLALISLGLASLNAVIGAVIYFTLLAFYKKGKLFH
ncbi:MAG: hypothetical protein ACUVRP_05885 [Chlorobiales bacterium]